MADSLPDAHALDRVVVGTALPAEAQAERGQPVDPAHEAQGTVAAGIARHTGTIVSSRVAVAVGAGSG